MVYRSVRPEPPRGSTEWGARQFYRLLDDEERIAAERKRLLAMGWRPRAAMSPPSSQRSIEDPAVGDERDAYADLIERDQAFRLALDGDARRRIGATHLGPTSKESPLPAQALPTQVGGGRLSITIPARSPNIVPVFDPAPIAPTFDPLVSRSPGRISSIVAAYIQAALALTALLTRTATTREEWEALQRKREAAEFAYRRLTHIMAAQFSKDEFERIKADSGVDFDVVDRASPAQTTASTPEEGHQTGDDWIAAIRPWIPSVARDMPEDEDEDYCFRRWQAERRRCGRWPLKWYNGCLERANNRHRLCVGNGGVPHPKEPDEWSEKDMETWYNPDR